MVAEQVAAAGARAPRRRRAAVAGRLLPVLLLLPLLPAATGCQVGYLAGLGVGQLGVVCGREDVADVLEDGELTEEQARKLRLAMDARDYAFEKIGLTRTDSYSTYYDTGGEPISYNVTACAKDRFARVTWWFPIVGTIPYKGYFEKEDAEEAAADLRARGFDARVSAVAAYSTLGYFSDPILSTMLRYEDDDLVDLIIHELTHAHVYIASDATFNENMATFVGHRGAIDFFTERAGPGSERVRAAQERRRDFELFGRFMNELYEELEALYAQPLGYEEVLARREEVFARAQRDFDRLRREQMSEGAFAGVTERPWDNATILAYRTYLRDLSVFEAVWRAEGCDLRAAVAAFVEASKTADPKKALQARAAGR